MTDEIELMISCSVCMQVMNSEINSSSTPIMCTPCGHRFCGRCILAWFSSNHNICPLCRNHVKAIITDNILNDIVQTLRNNKLINPTDYKCIEFEFQQIHVPPTTEYGISFANCKDKPGVYVLDVDSQKLSYMAGLRTGDRILAINMKSFNDVVHCRDIISNCIRNNEACAFLIEKRLIQNVVVNRHAFTIVPNEQRVKVINNYTILKKNDIIVGCNNVTGDKMIDELKKHGGVVNGKQYKRPIKSEVELVIITTRKR